MSKSIKLKNKYIDSTGIVHNKKILSNILKGIKIKPILATTAVINFTNGIGTYDISSLGLSQKPSRVLITSCIANLNFRYVFDNSSATSLQLHASYETGTLQSGIARCTIVIFDDI